MNLKSIITNKESWKLSKLLLSHLFIGLLLLSWFATFSHPFWENLDYIFYRFVNGFIENSVFWQNFWAISNHALTDWFHDIVMLVFFIFYFMKKSDKPLTTKICEMIFFALVIGFTIILINRYLCLDVLKIQRRSPSLVYDFAVDLSQKLHWIKVKGNSVTSYPGDHGTTAILFAMCMWHLMGTRVGLVAFLYSLYWLMPRLVTGCHWFTDVIMGSLVISTFVISWAVYTPFKESFIYVLSYPLRKQKQKTIIQP